MRERKPRGGRRKAAPARRLLCQKHVLMSLSNWQGRCAAKACSLLILDKGKPVARPGRKAKDRRIVSGGSLAAERIMLIASASDEGEVCFY